jgi:hypothetical protein
MVNYIQYTPELANDWKQASADVRKNYPHQFRRTLDASTASQLESKLWVVDELLKLPDTIEHLRVALLGGWFANFITPLLIDELYVSTVFNYEIDNDVKEISYKYNKRYKDSNKYQCSIKDIMMKTLEDDFDIIINCACEHMYPMTKFYEWNPKLQDTLYVLQSTDDDQYDDHINCVKDEFHLAEQANIVDIKYMGSKKLPNGMTRFMVIGK